MSTRERYLLQAMVPFWSGRLLRQSHCGSTSKHLLGFSAPRRSHNLPVLKKMGCNTCAYCKTCTMGFGRLAAWFFGKRELKDLNNKTALAFVAVVYFLLSLIPVAFLMVSLVQAFDAIKMAVLLSLLASSVYSLATWRKPRKQQTPSS